MRALQAVRSHLMPGQVYRRGDLTRWSNAVDRHLVQLQKDRTLLKIAPGLYFCPKETAFGEAPPSDYDLVEAFLKDSRFLLTTPNAYNTLGVGTTQLYNKAVVYNHKRHGQVKLGNRIFHFVIKHHFPRELTHDFLLVDLVDNLERLPEDRERVIMLVKEKSQSMDRMRLLTAVKHYGGVKSKKFFSAVLMDDSVRHGD
jgi:Family of unknown function (DUF6088)